MTIFIDNNKEKHVDIERDSYKLGHDQPIPQTVEEILEYEEYVHILLSYLQTFDKDYYRSLVGLIKKTDSDFVVAAIKDVLKHHKDKSIEVQASHLSNLYLFITKFDPERWIDFFSTMLQRYQQMVLYQSPENNANYEEGYDYIQIKYFHSTISQLKILLFKAIVDETMSFIESEKNASVKQSLFIPFLTALNLYLRESKTHPTSSADADKHSQELTIKLMAVLDDLNNLLDLVEQIRELTDKHEMEKLTAKLSQIKKHQDKLSAFFLDSIHQGEILEQLSPKQAEQVQRYAIIIADVFQRSVRTLSTIVSNIFSRMKLASQTIKGMRKYRAKNDYLALRKRYEDATEGLVPLMKILKKEAKAEQHLLRESKRNEERRAASIKTTLEKEAPPYH